MSEPLAYKPKDIPAATGVAYTRIRQAIDSGELEVAYPSAKRQIVTRAALEKWLASLPTERATA